MARATIIRRGSARFGTGTPALGDLAGVRVGLRGTGGVLNSASAGVGVTVGDAIRGGVRTTIITAAWLPREAGFQRARRAALPRGGKGQRQPNNSLGPDPRPATRAPSNPGARPRAPG